MRRKKAVILLPTAYNDGTKVPPEVIINNVNLCDELESVIYYVHKQIKGNGLKNLEILYRDMKY